MRLALITPTYHVDLERTKLLVESTARFAPAGVVHHLVVDRRERDLFAPLTRSHARLLIVEDLLPPWIFRLPMVRKWWMNLRGKPVRNWVLQQIVKMSVAGRVDADVLLFCDSDVCFVRPIPIEVFVRSDGAVRLSRVDFEGPKHKLWLQTASRLLDVPADRVPRVNFVGSLISWRSDVAIRLRDRLEEVSKRNWVKTVAREWDVSEYMLYGLFVEGVLGIEASGHFADQSPLMHLSWDYDFTTDAGVERFFDTLPASSIGVMIHSKNDVPIERYRRHVEAIWARS